MPRGKGKQRPSLKPVKPKPSPAAPPVDVCLEVLRRLEDVKDKLAFSAAFHNALEASRDKRAWTVCKTADVSTLYGEISFFSPWAQHHVSTRRIFQ